MTYPPMESHRQRKNLKQWPILDNIIYELVLYFGQILYSKAPSPGVDVFLIVARHISLISCMPFGINKIILPLVWSVSMHKGVSTQEVDMRSE